MAPVSPLIEAARAEKTKAKSGKRLACVYLGDKHAQAMAQAKFRGFDSFSAYVCSLIEADAPNRPKASARAGKLRRSRRP